MPNLDSAILLLNTVSKNVTEQEIITAAINYFKYLNDVDYNEYIHKLMYNDLFSHKNDNTLILDYSVIGDITAKENEAIGLRFSQFKNQG